MNERERTIQTYDEQAPALAEYFRDMGARVEDIERAIEMTQREEPHIVEIGCGDGRDALEILKRTPHYRGMDISQGMLDLARNLNPDGHFIWGDVANFEIPDDTDIVFGFASFLHSPAEDIQSFLSRSYPNLSQEGLVYLSLKYGDTYTSEVKEDEFGNRLFYFYSPEFIEELAGTGYSRKYLDFQRIGNNDWFTLVLRKQ